jgi:hypothetical protein
MGRIGKADFGRILEIVQNGDRRDPPVKDPAFAGRYSRVKSLPKALLLFFTVTSYCDTALNTTTM